MSSPNHKAGLLGVVVPATDKRSPPRADPKHPFGSPRKSTFSGLTASQQAKMFPPPPYVNGSNGTDTPRQPNGPIAIGQVNGASDQRQQNGVAPQKTNCAIPARPRLLGVEEALQYSPFSSIVPFSSDIIPTPNANLPGSQPIFSTPDEKRTARHPLDYLNEELAKGQGCSSIAQRAIDDVKSYLAQDGQDGITDFQFKTFAKIYGKQGVPQSKANGNDYKRSPSKAGPFANMILNATDLSHRYPTPISPEHSSPKSGPRSTIPQQETISKAKNTANLSQPETISQLPATPALPRPQEVPPISKPMVQLSQQPSPVTPSNKRFIHNEVAHSQNKNISANGAHTPSSIQARAVPMVIIPCSSADAMHTDFVTYEDSLSKGGKVSRKRKRDSKTQLGSSLPQTKDQRAASDETVRQIQHLIQDIFDADDVSQSEGIGARSSLKMEYFVLVTHEDREFNTFGTSIHVNLETSLHKTIAVGRLGEIPVEHLQRLQGLCEGALYSADSANLQVEPKWSCDEFASWVQKLDAVDLGLRSARTILRIMTGDREEKQLYSEELLQSVIAVVKKTLECCIIPVVEARSSGANAAIFEAASSHKRVISQLLFDTSKVMVLLARLLTKVEMAEMIITNIEFFATALLFVETSPSEKESVLGVQKFESLRRTAMDIIAVIFARYPDQRLFLLDEILSSVQKLPVSRQHARQFRLGDGTSIQLVSALIMRLVQTCATQTVNVTKKTPKQPSRVFGVEQGSESGWSGAEDGDASDASGDGENPRKDTAIQVLRKKASSLLDNAAKSAQYVVRHLVQRAMTSSKTGDSPYRQLLDIFVGDLVSVLSLPEWPGAELMLWMLLASCRNIAESTKSLAPAKNMALELLGMMGSAISELVSNTRHSAKNLENDTSKFSVYMQQVLDNYTDGSFETREVLMWNGAYHAVVEYLESYSSDDAQIESAEGYYLARWAKAVASEDLEQRSDSDDIAVKLRKMLSGAAWFASDSLDGLSNGKYRIAYALSLLSMDFCRQFDYILRILLDSVTSEQITVRTRSLKSVTQMLEKDPSILDRARGVKVLIIKCATDNSSMVRDSALTLIGKCVALKPALEAEFLGHILRLTEDPAAGVRKRSMKLLKDIYLQNNDRNVKTAIGDSLLQRAKDFDTGVSDLARQTFEDIWLSPFWTYPNLVDASAQNKVALREQASIIIATVRRGDKVASVLEHLLKEVLSNNSKNAAGNFKVCKFLVATAFDMIIDNSEESGHIEQRHILHTGTVFAKADARLFTPDQLQALQPYITNLSSKDDLDIFRATVIIFRCVLPVLSNVQENLLKEISKHLLQSVSKLGKAELNEVAECLWTINGTLQKPDNVVRLVLSVLKNLRNTQSVTFADSEKNDDLKRLRKYIQIAGYFGKHCDFEPHDHVFQNYLPWWKGGSVAGLIVQLIYPYTDSKQPLSLRAEAFDSIGLICQSWPYQFTQEHTSKAFQDVLRKGEPELQSIVLSSFRDFFARIDRQAQQKGADALPGANAPAEGKLGGSMKASDGDGASALIAQHFLKDTLSIALASQGTSALTATEVIASINRQGLVHPKESGPALVALETSTNPAIADIAFEEHRLLHQQHESMFEREYMRAVQEAFRYQRDIVKDSLGYTKQPYASKLSGMFEIIKTSKSKYRKKFLSNLCSKIDFDISTMDLEGSPPNTLQFSRFLTENLAFFDYGRLDELQHTISCLEKIVANTGSGIAHTISTEVFNITVESLSQDQDINQQGSQPQGSAEASPGSTIAHPRLFHLTTAAVILSSLWETRTYLKRLYGLSAGQQKKEGKAKVVMKDLNKAPSRVTGLSGDKIVTAIAEKVDALATPESMIQQCQYFVELMSVDSEVRFAAEGEEDLERPETPSEEEERDMRISGGSRGTKRRGSVSISGTPGKKRGRPSINRRKSGKSVGSDESWD